MDHSMEIFHQVFAIIIFCIAVTILFIGYSNYNSVLAITKKLLTQDNIMYEQYNESNEIIITKGEIITLLFNPLECDIEINGLLISKTENVKENISYYAIADGNYVKQYAYDSKGNITRIIFKSVVN